MRKIQIHRTEGADTNTCTDKGICTTPNTGASLPRTHRKARDLHDNTTSHHTGNKGRPTARSLNPHREVGGLHSTDRESGGTQPGDPTRLQRARILTKIASHHIEETGRYTAIRPNLHREAGGRHNAKGESEGKQQGDTTQIRQARILTETRERVQAENQKRENGHTKTRHQQRREADKSLHRIYPAVCILHRSAQREGAGVRQTTGKSKNQRHRQHNLQCELQRFDTDTDLQQTEPGIKKTKVYGKKKVKPTNHKCRKHLTDNIGKKKPTTDTETGDRTKKATDYIDRRKRTRKAATCTERSDCGKYTGENREDAEGKLRR